MCPIGDALAPPLPGLCAVSGVHLFLPGTVLCLDVLGTGLQQQRGAGGKLRVLRRSRSGLGHCECRLAVRPSASERHYSGPPDSDNDRHDRDPGRRHSLDSQEAPD